MVKSSLIKIDSNMVIGSLIIVVASFLALGIPILLQQAIDTSAAGLNRGLLFWVVALFLLQAIFLSLGNFLMIRSGERQIADLRQRLSQNLLQTTLAFFDGHQSTALASMLVNDTNLLRDFLVETVPSLVSGLIMIVGSLVVLVLLDWKLSLVLFGCFPILLLLMSPLSKKRERFTLLMQEKISQLMGDLTEAFQEVELIKANTAEGDTLHRLSKRISETQGVAVKMGVITAMESPFVLLCLFGMVALVFTYGGYRVSRGDLSIGTLISFLIYLFQLINPVGNLSSVFTRLSEYRAVSTILEDLIDLEQESSAGDVQVPPGDLLVQEVSFSYDGETSIFDGLSLTIPQGKKVALVGPSGSGKTTLIRLLERFYSPQLGGIRLGGRELTDFSLLNWRQSVALVSQASAVLSGTVRDNLLLGLNRTPSQEEIQSVLQDVSLAEEINRLPNGLDTFIGEKGKLLSGGQRQRLQIARAYLRQASVIVFDEATSNLDADNEYLVTQSLNRLLKGRTALIIAHRLSTIVDADLIYFLEDHRITGQGTHEQLLESHEGYARFVREQMI